MQKIQNVPVLGAHGIIIFDGTCGACSALIAEKRVFFEIVTMEKKALMEKYFDFKPEDSET